MNVFVEWHDSFMLLIKLINKKDDTIPTDSVAFDFSKYIANKTLCEV